MMPLEVPTTTEVDTAMHVARPKFRFPTSENAWPVIFLSFVHRTTSQGAGDVSESGSGVEENAWLANDEFRE